MMFKFTRWAAEHRYTVSVGRDDIGVVDKVGTKWLTGKVKLIGGKIYWTPDGKEFKTRKAAAEYLYKQFMGV